MHARTPPAKTDDGCCWRVHVTKHARACARRAFGFYREPPSPEFCTVGGHTCERENGTLFLSLLYERCRISFNESLFLNYPFVFISSFISLFHRISLYFYLLCCSTCDFTQSSNSLETTLPRDVSRKITDRSNKRDTSYPPRRDRRGLNSIAINTRIVFQRTCARFAQHKRMSWAQS